MLKKHEVVREIPRFIRQVDERATKFSRQIDEAAKVLGVEPIALKRIVKPLLQALLDKHLGE